MLEDAGENLSEILAYEWLCKKSEDNEVNLYWKMVMELQIGILIYVRSIREGNFRLHLETLRKLLKYFFIFDRYNYARWLTVHWFDLKNLESNFPDVYQYFSQGFSSSKKPTDNFHKLVLTKCMSKIMQSSKVLVERLIFSTKLMSLGSLQSRIGKTSSRIWGCNELQHTGRHFEKWNTSRG